MDYQLLAQQAAAVIGVPWEWVYAQWQHETANFSDYWFLKDNNFGNIKGLSSDPRTGANGFLSFSTPEEGASYYAQYVSKYYPGANAATTADEYLNNLYSGGYFTVDDNANNAYFAAVNNYIAQLTGGKGATNATPAAAPVTDTGLIETLKKGFSSVATAPANMLTAITDFGTKTVKIVVGLVLFVFGVYLLFKDNILVMQKEE